MKIMKITMLVALVSILVLCLALVIACGAPSVSSDDDDDADDADDDSNDDLDDDDGDDDFDDDANDDVNDDLDDDASDVWEDSTSGLVWQVEPTDDKMNGEEAMSHCEGLILGGYSDWRLPTISELRSLIRGCPATETGGLCGVTDSCKEDDCSNDACLGCERGFGPGPEGAYWPVELAGDCSDEHFYSGYWSSVGVLSGIEMNSWLVGFNGAYVTHISRARNNRVRCVR